MDKPDEKSVMTYVAQFLHKYPETKTKTNFENNFYEIQNWLLTKIQLLKQFNETDSFPTNFQDYYSLKMESEKRLLHYKNTVNNVEIIDNLWADFNQLMINWLWFFDEHISDDFKTIALWVKNGELLLLSDKKFDFHQGDTCAQTVSIISTKLEEHNSYFSDYEIIQEKFFHSLKQFECSLYIDYLSQRLHDLGRNATRRKNRLQFFEHKYCLIAFIDLSEDKLNKWTTKYRDINDVLYLLDQYQNFIAKNNIFQEFQKAYTDMQNVIAESISSKNIGNFLIS